MKHDKEFQAISARWPLTEQEQQGLEQDILTRGCLTPLMTWEGRLVDGYHRHAICVEHGVPFEAREMEFADRAAAKWWALETMKARRNLAPFARGEIALAQKAVLAGEAKERQQTGKGPDGSGGRGRQKPSPNIEGRLSKHAGETVTKLAESANLSAGTMHKVELLHTKAPEEVKAKLRSGETTINREYVALKRQERQEKMADEMQLPTGKYRVLYADPPWNYGNSGIIGDSDNYGHAERHYPSMTIQELCDLEVKAIAEDNAVLFLWVTSPLLAECWPVIKAWGFVYKTSFVWDKIRHNFGHYNSVRHEFLLVCTRGSCTPDSKELHDSVISLKRSKKHSEKPEYFRELIEKLYPTGQRLELFARPPIAKGWDAFGNE